MAPKVTSSGNRSGRKPTKPPVVTTSKGRGNRSAVSTAKPTSGSNGKPPASGARVTNASQRTSNGSARVTGTPRAALPPGTPRPTRPSIGNVSGPASSPKPPGTNANLRPSGPVRPVSVRDLGNTNRPQVAPGQQRSLPQGQPSTRRQQAQAKQAQAAAGTSGPNRVGQPAGSANRVYGANRVNASVNRAVNSTRLGRNLSLGRGGAAATVLGLISAVQDQFLSKDQLDKKYVNEKGKVYNEVRQNLFGKDKPVSKDANGRSSQGIRISDTRRTVATGSQEYNDYRRQQLAAEKDRLSKIGNVTIPTAARPPATGSGGSSSTPSRGGTTPRRSGSTSPARKASTAATPPSERRVSASTANRESGNYGTSKTNNPLMKDLVGRIKDREDKAQSSAAKNLTSKFNTESNFSGEKVDGSKVDTKAKINSTTSEYDKKKRRYGG